MFLEWHAKAETGDRRVLDRAYTQQEIADRIGCGRERVSRMLARMVELGLILTSGRRPMELLKPLPRRL